MTSSNSTLIGPCLLEDLSKSLVETSESVPVDMFWTKSDRPTLKLPKAWSIIKGMKHIINRMPATDVCTPTTVVAKALVVLIPDTTFCSNCGMMKLAFSSSHLTRVRLLVEVAAMVLLYEPGPVYGPCPNTGWNRSVSSPLPLKAVMLCVS